MRTFRWNYSLKIVKQEHSDFLNSIVTVWLKQDKDVESKGINVTTAVSLEHITYLCSY